MKRYFYIFALLAAGIAFSGCASLSAVDQKKIDAYLADKPKELHPFLTKVVAGEKRNRALNQMRAGLAAMKSGHNDLAAKLFDDALLTIETIYGGDEKAAKARGLFSAEDRKVFRGEPYERAMLYYYRGILYLMQGDYENARASFKSGYLQDTLAEKEKFRGDFALLAFLEGWASQCNGKPRPGQGGILPGEKIEQPSGHSQAPGQRADTGGPWIRPREIRRRGTWRSPQNQIQPTKRAAIRHLDG